MKYILIGNPNVGKSSLFNRLTTSFAQVGNIGGVTVESKVGVFSHGEIVDLPGTYSVAPNSQDEGVVTETLIQGGYDRILNIVDATHLKRNLHLTIELLEFGLPMNLVLNMTDELEVCGYQVKEDVIKKHFGIPVHLVSARKGNGIEALKDELKDEPTDQSFQLVYDPIIEGGIQQLEELMVECPTHLKRRWLAIQLLCGNSGIKRLLDEDIQSKVQTIIQKTEQQIIDSEIALSLKGAIYNNRRQFIQTVVDQAIIRTGETNYKKLLNHRIDRILMHPVWGLLIFILVLLGLYTLTFDWLGTPLSDWLDGLVNDHFAPWLNDQLIGWGVSESNVFLNMLIDGIIPSVGGVIVFVPNILILFTFIAIFDGTGYMARVAVMLDTLLKRFGLNGKAIVPLITGIGCNVPAIMATRTIEDKKERLLTIMVIPFMSCSARIPIYGLMASLFFEKYRGFIILSMYVLGTLVALVSTKVLSLSLFKIDQKHFMIEIPPYRLPSARNVYRYARMMVIDFIEKAGKFILLGSMILWFLQYLGPKGVAATQDESFLAIMGGIFTPLFIPLGFGNWQAASSLIVGFFAKEMIFSSMMIIYNGEAAITTMFNPASAYAFMVFSLLYMPCLAAVGVIKSETRTLRFTLLSVSYTMVVSFLVSLLAYGIGLIFI